MGLTCIRKVCADFFYNEPQYHWVVMMMNKMHSRYFDWPFTYNELQAYTLDKYSNPNGRHHYEISQSSGDTTVKINIGNDNTGHLTATAITNFEYESALNENKKQIKILSRPYIHQFVNEFKDLLNNLQ